MKKQINFTKMHGLGNDFIVLDAINQSVSLKDIPIAKLSSRHAGIGFDQLLLIEPSKTADFTCRIFNADGTEAEQCGNGMRCVARFLHENNFLQKNNLTLQTKAGVIDIAIQDYDHIQVNMGKPTFFTTTLKDVTALSMGNPHAISLVDSLENYPVDIAGKRIGSHPDFPEGANVGFLEIIDRKNIRLRTYERGVGETCACGSNSCAAVVAGIKNNWLDKKVTVELALGKLQISWENETAPVIMTGPAEKVFDGVFSI